MDKEETKQCGDCKNPFPLSTGFYLRSKKDQAKARTEGGKYGSICRKCLKIREETNVNLKWRRIAGSLRRRGVINIGLQEVKDHLGEPSVCYLCGKPLSWADASPDHIIPLSKGGSPTLDNVAWTHADCNMSKHSLLLAEFVQLIEDILKHQKKGKNNDD